MDTQTRYCLAKALDVDPKYVTCEAYAYSVLCKHRRGENITPANISELWDLLPSCFKYHENEGKYTVLGANPRKHEAVTIPTDALPHVVKTCTSYIKQFRAQFEFSTVSLRLNMSTPPHRDTGNGPKLLFIPWNPLLEVNCG